MIHDEVAPEARVDERDVLVQVSFIAGTLRRLGHDVDSLAVGPDLGRLQGALRERRPEAVFNLVESCLGSCRLAPSAPALLETLGVPFTGAGSVAMAITNHKLAAKRLLAANGLPTPDWIEPAALQRTSDLPPGSWIVKGTVEHASVGIGGGSVISGGGGAARQARARAAHIGGEAFAERFIEGREFNVGLLAAPDGVEVLPICEIVFEGDWADRPRIVGYAAKWDEDSFEYGHTPRRYDFGPTDAPLLRELEALARRCWHVFDMRGYARVDVRIGEAPTILEVNSNPCLSPDAGFVAACDRAGLEREAIVARILDSAFTREN